MELFGEKGRGVFPSSFCVVSSIQLRGNSRSPPATTPPRVFSPGWKKVVVPLRPAPPSPKTSQCLLSFRSRTAGQARRRTGRGWGRGVRDGCGGIRGRRRPGPAAAVRVQRVGEGRRLGARGVQITRPFGRPPWTRSRGRAA